MCPGQSQTFVGRRRTKRCGSWATETIPACTSRHLRSLLEPSSRGATSLTASGEPPHSFTSFRAMGCAKKRQDSGLNLRQVHNRQHGYPVSCLILSAELAWSSSGTSSTVASSAHRLASRLRQAFMLLSAASGTVIVSAVRAAHQHLLRVRCIWECGAYGHVTLKSVAFT